MHIYTKLPLAIFVFFTFFFSYSASSEEIIIKDGDFTVTTKDAQAMLNEMTWRQKQKILSDEEKFKSLLLDYLNLKKREKAAIEKNIHEEPSIQWKLKISKMQILANELTKDFEEKIDLPHSLEALAQEKYNANPEKYKVEEKVSVAHILVPIKDNNEDLAMKKALSIIKEIKNGLDFEEAAKKYSSDKGSAQRGGVINYFGRGQTVKPFESASFSMKEKGEISEPIKSQFGFHIIKFIGRIDARTIPFSEVKQQLLSKEIKKYKKEKTEEYLNNFKPKKSTNIYLGPLKELVEEQKNKTKNPLNEKQ